MDRKHEGNQAASPLEHSESHPEELCLKTAMNIANDKIATLEKKIRDMEEFQRPAETEKPNLRQMSEGDSELNLLVSLEESIDRRLKNIKRQQHRESELVDLLQLQVRLSKQDRDEVVEQFSELKGIIVDLFKGKEDLELRLRESQNELLMEKAKHLRSVDALEAKIKSLVEKEDQDPKKQEIKEPQDKQQSVPNELKEGMVNLTNDNVHSKLNDASNQLSLQEEPMQKIYEALERKYQRKLNKTILSMRQTNQTTQTILDNKFKEELHRNYSLLAQLGEACDECTLLKDSNKQLIDARVALVDERRLLIDERTLLEDICLKLKKKCRGTFGRRMQEREVEIDKMKRKMRETQTVRLTQTLTLTETETQPEMLFEGTTRDADGPRPLAPYSLRKRLKHLDE